MIPPIPALAQSAAGSQDYVISVCCHPDCVLIGCLSSSSPDWSSPPGSIIHPVTAVLQNVCLIYRVSVCVCILCWIALGLASIWFVINVWRSFWSLVFNNNNLGYIKYVNTV